METFNHSEAVLLSKSIKKSYEFKKGKNILNYPGLSELQGKSVSDPGKGEGAALSMIHDKINAMEKLKESVVE